MALVYHYILPIKLAQSRFVIQDILVSRQDHMEVLIFKELGQGRSLILLAFVGDDSNCGRPFLELVDPILDCDEWHND